MLKKDVDYCLGVPTYVGTKSRLFRQIRKTGVLVS